MSASGNAPVKAPVSPGRTGETSAKPEALATVKPWQLLAGKILGLGLLGRAWVDLLNYTGEFEQSRQVARPDPLLQ